MEKGKKIVFINQNSGYLMIDIIDAFKLEYSERVLIAGKVIPRNKPLEKEVYVDKIIEYNRKSTIKRLFTWFFGFIQIIFKVLIKHRNCDLFIVSNPPFTVFLPLFCRNKFSLLIYDVYPDSITDFTSIGSNNPLVKMWSRVNRKVFSRAENIYTIGNGMKSALSKYVDLQKIKVVPIWTDNSFLRPIEKGNNLFLQDKFFKDKFLIFYSGNLGFTQNPGVILDLAKALLEDGSIHLVIIGEGNMKAQMMERIEKEKLLNVSIFPLQSVEMLPHSLSSGDIAIVTSGIKASKLSVPSKTYNLMSVGIPLLCLAADDSELGNLVKQFDNGICIEPSNIKGMIDFIYTLKNDKERLIKMGENSFQASKMFDSQNAKLFVS